MCGRSKTKAADVLLDLWQQSSSIFRTLGVAKQNQGSRHAVSGPCSKAKASVARFGAHQSSTRAFWGLGSKTKASFALLESRSKINASDVLVGTLAAKPKHPSDARDSCGLGSKAKASFARLESRSKIKAADVLFGALQQMPTHASHVWRP